MVAERPYVRIARYEYPEVVGFVTEVGQLEFVQVLHPVPIVIDPHVEPLSSGHVHVEILAALLQAGAEFIEQVEYGGSFEKGEIMVDPCEVGVLRSLAGERAVRNVQTAVREGGAQAFARIPCQIQPEAVRCGQSALDQRTLSQGAVPTLAARKPPFVLESVRTLQEGFPFMELIAASDQALRGVRAEQVALVLVLQPDGELLEALLGQALVAQEIGGSCIGRGQPTRGSDHVGASGLHVAVQFLFHAPVGVRHLERAESILHLSELPCPQTDLGFSDQLIADQVEAKDVPISIEFNSTVTLHETEVARNGLGPGTEQEVERGVLCTDRDGMFPVGHKAIPLVIGLVRLAEGVAVFVAVGEFHRRIGAGRRGVIETDRDQLLTPRSNKNTDRSVITTTNQNTIDGVRCHPPEHAAVGGEFLLHIIAQPRTHLCEGDPPDRSIGVRVVPEHGEVPQRIQPLIKHLIIRESRTIHPRNSGKQRIISRFTKDQALLITQLLLQGLVTMVLLAIDVEAEGALSEVHGMIQSDQGACVVLVRVLEFHRDASVLRDQPFRSERDLCGVVVDHVIILLSTHQQQPIDEHALGAGKNDDDTAAVVPTQAIRSLHTFDPLDHVAGEFAFADRDACTDPRADVIGVLERCFETDPFGLLQVGEEMALGALEHEITGDQRPSFAFFPFEEFDEDLIEVLKLEGIATRLDRDVVVRDAGQHLDPVR